MKEILAALPLLALVAFSVYALRLLVPRIDRALVVLESRHPENKPMPDDEPMPVDMVQWCLAEAFDWAREDKEKRMRELYQKLRDWEKVRRVMMQEDDIPTRSTFN